jgi:hypothetical protein
MLRSDPRLTKSREEGTKKYFLANISGRRDRFFCFERNGGKKMSDSPRHMKSEEFHL